MDIICVHIIFIEHGAAYCILLIIVGTGTGTGFYLTCMKRVGAVTSMIIRVFYVD